LIAWAIVKAFHMERFALFGVKFGDDAVTRYWNVTVAMARLTEAGV
jgi:hypothetical protein